MGGWVGVVIGITFSLKAICHGSSEVDFFRMVKLSNLDCLFKAINMTDLYLFLADDCGYIPQQSIQIIGANVKFI